MQSDSTAISYDVSREQTVEHRHQPTEGQQQSYHGRMATKSAQHKKITRERLLAIGWAEAESIMLDNLGLLGLKPRSSGFPKAVCSRNNDSTSFYITYNRAYGPNFTQFREWTERLQQHEKALRQTDLAPLGPFFEPLVDVDMKPIVQLTRKIPLTLKDIAMVFLVEALAESPWTVYNNRQYPMRDGELWPFTLFYGGVFINEQNTGVGILGHMSAFLPQSWLTLAYGSHYERAWKKLNDWRYLVHASESAQATGKAQPIHNAMDNRPALGASRYPTLFTFRSRPVDHSLDVSNIFQVHGFIRRASNEQFSGLRLTLDQPQTTVVKPGEETVSLGEFQRNFSHQEKSFVFFLDLWDIFQPCDGINQQPSGTNWE